MEYSLYSYSKSQQDFINVIEYELNLESLRKIRKKRLGLFLVHLLLLGIDKSLPSDYHILNRITFTFERMVRKYYSDLSVWLRYVEYCETTQNFSRLSQLYPRFASKFAVIVEFCSCILELSQYG